MPTFIQLDDVVIGKNGWCYQGSTCKIVYDCERNSGLCDMFIE